MASPSDSMRRRIAAFFTAYGRALGAGDLPAIAGAFDLPGLVLAESVSIPVATAEDVEAGYAEIAEQHRALGVTHARPTILDAEWMSARLISADVRWDFLDASDTAVAHDGSRYILRLDAADQPRIQVIVQVPAYAGATASTARV